MSWLSPAAQQCFTPGTWYYIVLERDASGNTSFYVNGQLESVGSWSSGSHTPNAPQGGTEIGGQFDASNNPWRYFDGSIAQVAFYNYALTGSQILSHYNAAVTPPAAPQNTSLPTISGSPQDGQTLTAAPGSWSGSTPLSYAYQWQTCDASGANCQNISGATSSTYTAAAPDIGHTIQVQVTASNSLGSVPATSAATTAVTAAPPSNTSAPTISGTGQPGQQLTANAGTWSGTAPLSYTYQWQRCDSAGKSCQNVDGATQQNYSLAAADVGSTVVVVVTGSNAAGSASATSDHTAVVGSPTNSSLPTISGTAEDGQTLTASNGDWTDSSGLSYSYQWAGCDSSGANCSNITGAASSTYLLGPGDVGKTVEVVVTATNAAGSTSATSQPTSSVIAAPPPTITNVTHSNLPSGPVSGGADTITATATSTGPGIESFQITDQRGDTLANYSAECAGTNASPCQATSVQDLTVDYGKLPLGQDTLYLVAIDAAGNASSGQSWNVTVIAPTSCTDNWTGAAGDGLWQTAANWSNGTLPGDHDDACIPSGATVQLSSGNNPVGHLDSQGTLQISSGTLTVDDVSAASTTNGLAISGGGNLAGAGEVDVAASLTWTGGEMSGSGSTVLESAASGTIDPGNGSSGVTLDTRSLSNQGTLTLASGTLHGYNGATITNSNVLALNSEANYWGPTLNASGGATPQLINTSTGTVEKASGSGVTQSQWTFDNHGTLDDQTGQLSFPSGGDTWEDGSTIKGTIVLNGASVNMGGGVNAQNATLKVQSGTLTDGTSPDIVGNLDLSSGNMNGAGEVDVTGTLSWTGGEMSGSGSTVLESGASGVIDPGDGSAGVSLDTRSLSNQGTLTLASGTLHGYDGATITNSGEFTLNSEANYWGPTLNASGGATPQLINSSTGTIDKTTGSGSTGVQFAIDNEGVVDAQSGQLNFSGGGGSSTSGSWSAPVSGTSINFSAGNFTLGAGTQATGDLTVSGGSVSVPDIHDPSGTLSLTNGSLNLTSSSTASTTNGLAISGGGNLAGAGEVDVAASLTWTGGEMSGSGSTVLESAASGTIDPGNGSSGVTLDTRSLSNQGTLTLASGTLHGYNGATITNSNVLALNSEANYWGPTLNASGGATPQLINTSTGTTTKNSNSGTTAIGFEFDNEGQVESDSGNLVFDGGGVPWNALSMPASFDSSLLDNPTLCPVEPTAQTGSWTASAGTTITFGFGCWTLDSGSNLSGNIAIAGANVQIGAIQAQNAALEDNGGTLDVETGFLDLTPAVVGTLNLGSSAATLSGPGEIDIATELAWQGGTMQGSGATVINDGATAQIQPAGSVQLVGRSLVNRGTVNWSSGSIQTEADAVIWNANQFYANSDGGNITEDGTGPILYNTGSITKTAGSGTTEIDALLFNQAGSATRSTSGTIVAGGENQDQTAPSQPGVCSQVSQPGSVGAGWINLLGGQQEVVAAQVSVACAPGSTASGDAGTIYASTGSQPVAIPSSGAGCSGPSCVVTLGALLAGGQAGFAEPGTQENYQASDDFEYPGDETGPQTVETNDIVFPVALTQVPTPSSGETWSQYQQTLHNDGIGNTKRQITTTPYLDGPAADVLSVSPTPGTWVNPATAVVEVTTNPDAMPQVSDRVERLAVALEQSKNPGMSDENKVTIATQCLRLLDAATGDTDKTGDSGDDSFVKCSTLPIFITGSDAAQAAEHDLAALGARSDPNAYGGINPTWVLLHRDVSGKSSAWKYSNPPCNQGSAPAGMQCDEYPFISTQEGGPGANLEYIDGIQNGIQGNRLGGFYGNTPWGPVGGLEGCNLSVGQPFLAIPLDPDLMPPGVTINTTWLCNGSNGAG